MTNFVEAWVHEAPATDFASLHDAHLCVAGPPPMVSAVVLLV